LQVKVDQALICYAERNSVADCSLVKPIYAKIADFLVRGFANFVDNIEIRGIDVQGKRGRV